MAEEQHQARADPELLRQLDDRSAAAEPVVAVFALRHPQGVVLSPDEVESLTSKLVRRVEREGESDVKDVNVFQNVGMFAVAADPSLIRLFLEQPEIESGVANQQRD
ncbi:hypothetical protein AB0E69_26185 [Kribbella sp. NPDC026611]|uniref:hypothetical protein n=1 Tax=Kribbella sp. NPDC026611 TaxID=3154911 RepID=UPI0033CE4550